MHRVAFRQGLGNSLFCAKHNIKKISSETLQHYVAENFTTNRTAVVGLGVNHEQLVQYAQNMCLESGDSDSSPSKYYGGEVRSEKGGELTYIAIGAQGGALCNQKEALAFAVLQRVYGVGPHTKRGLNSSGALSKAVSGSLGDAPFAVSAINASYSDAGLFGVFLAAPAKCICEPIVSAVKVLKSGSVSDEDVNRAKNQLKTAVLLNAESGGNFIEVMGNQAAVLGSVATPDQIVAAIEGITSADVKQVHL